MGLTDLWRRSQDELAGKQVQQVIAIAGEGKLRTGNSTCLEFREFLSHVSSELLCRYADECLTHGFPDSGFALQDIVNQVGKRLGFSVEDGLYQGSRSTIGHDGLWRFPDGHGVVVEVKTTDAYRINSEKIAEYRKALIATHAIEEDKSSILIVVGRQDTGDLEAQIRGSRHAWDIRIISIDALLRLMRLKESVDDPEIISRICNILIPKEFTRLDGIVEIVFFATEDAKQEIELAEEEPEDADSPATITAKSAVVPAAFHSACVRRFAQRNDITLVKQSRNSYLDPSGDCRVVCAVSKRHEAQNRYSYWFAFHPHHKEFLEKSDNSFVILGCGSEETVLAIPFSDVEGWLQDLWTTERENRMYWHIRIHEVDGELLLDRRKEVGRVDVTPYKLPST